MTLAMEKADVPQETAAVDHLDGGAFTTMMPGETVAAGAPK